MAPLKSPQLYPWNVSYWQHLQQYSSNNRVPQALLLSGNPGLGKQHLALQFAYSLLCEQPLADGFACGHCHGCRLLAADSHPDFIRVTPDGDSKGIGIDVIRRLLPQLSLKPQYAGLRIVLINSAELLNTHAANAFLKCLEEPNDRTIIILISASANSLPVTILSRCQVIKLLAPPASLAATWLVEQGVLTDHTVLLNLANGSPLLALQYAHEHYAELRSRCFEEWMSITQQQNPVSIAERWEKLPSAPLLNWISSWVADLIKGHFEIKAIYFYNPDLQPLLQEVQKRLDLKALFGLYDVVLAAQKQCNTQLNKHLLFEVILIQWFNLNYRD